MAQRNASIRGEQIKDAFFGLALIRNAGDNNVADVNVDDSSIEVSADALQVKALGITNAMLTGSITAAKLVDDYIITSEVDGTTIEFSGGTLNVVANGIGAAQIDETDTYDYTSGIVRVAAPVGTTDAANKAYVDGVANGLDWKESVRVATTANVTLTGEQTIDGILTSADRILVKNQSSGAENGIYVTAAGAWSRAADLAIGDSAASNAVFVEEGTLAADTGYTCRPTELIHNHTHLVVSVTHLSKKLTDAFGLRGKIGRADEVINNALLVDSALSLGHKYILYRQDTHHIIHILLKYREAG